MMERVLGPLPQHMTRKAKYVLKYTDSGYFFTRTWLTKFCIGSRALLSFDYFIELEIG